MKINPLSYFHLETFLMSEVRGRFEKNKSICAFDFFSIIVWKSNRSKSKVAARLLEIEPYRMMKNQRPAKYILDLISRKITSSLSGAENPKEKLKILICDWGFRLPIASAILTVLFPDTFTPYDYRVREQVDVSVREISFGKKSNFNAVWNDYERFKRKVQRVKHGKNLREKDQYLFGKSRLKDLRNDIAKGFL